MVMEYLKNGSLLELLRKHKALSEDKVKGIMKDVIEAVSYLHKKKNIIHRDIKP